MQNGKNFERSTTGCELSISPGDGVGCIVGFELVLGLGSGFGDGVGSFAGCKTTSAVGSITGVGIVSG